MSAYLNVQWIERVEMVEGLIHNSGGVGITTLSRVLGISRDAVERAVKALVQEGRRGSSGIARQAIPLRGLTDGPDG